MIFIRQVYSILLKIGENQIIIDNKKENNKVDLSKFINWLIPQISGGNIYYIFS